MPIYAEGPNGLLATLEPSRLIIRDTETRLLLRNIELDPRMTAAVRQMKWFRAAAMLGDSDNTSSTVLSSSMGAATTVASKSERLLLATAENVHVYEVQNQRWTAVVKKPCGEGKQLAWVDFGASEDELLAYSGLGLKISIHSLATGAATDVRDPKSPAARGHSLRAQSGHLALLTRPAAKDVLTVLPPDRRDAEWSAVLPTIDAQGVRWSPDGKWLAVWDAAASAGSSLLVYTAAGQLFKRLSGGGGGGGDGSGGSGGPDLGYGIQRVDWDPQNRFLVVAANEGKVVLLSTRSFRPAVALEYPRVVGSAHAPIHEEQIASNGSRAYRPAQQPVAPPPPSSSNQTGPLGFAHLSVAPSGDLLACVPACMPGAVWIHSIHPNPQLTAVLIHHGNVRQLAWHQHQHGLLLIHCSQKGTGAEKRQQQQQQAQQPQQQQQDETIYEPAIHVWGYNLPEPLIVPVALPDSGRSAGAAQSTITRATWLDSAVKTQAVVVSSESTCSLVSVLEPELDDDEDDENAGDFPTPKPAASRHTATTTTTTRRLANVDATPAPMLGYDSAAGLEATAATPLTSATGASSFSPVKMDTDQLTRALGFQFTSLKDAADDDDTFDFKRPIRSRG